MKIIIGGAPVGADFDHRIGANAHGADATEVVTLARILMNQPGIRAQINQRLWETSEKKRRGWYYESKRTIGHLQAVTDGLFKQDCFAAGSSQADR